MNGRMRREQAIVKEICMEIYKIKKSKNIKEVNEQFERKMNYDLGENINFFWKKVSEAKLRKMDRNLEEDEK